MGTLTEQPQQKKQDSQCVRLELGAHRPEGEEGNTEQRISPALFSPGCTPRAHPPDEDDDRGRLRHGSHQAAEAEDAQEDEENLLAALHGTLPGDGRGQLSVGRHARAAAQVLQEGGLFSVL